MVISVVTDQKRIIFGPVIESGDARRWSDGEHLYTRFELFNRMYICSKEISIRVVLSIAKRIAANVLASGAIHFKQRAVHTVKMPPGTISLSFSVRQMSKVKSK